MLASDESKLPAAHRELLILRVAWRTRSGYEWSQHSRMGMDAGLTEQQIEAVAAGPAAAVWTPLERTLLTAVDEVVDEHAVGDATWAELAAHFEPAEILELLFLIGGYLCLAGVLNSIGLQGPLPDAAGGAASRGEEASPVFGLRGFDHDADGATDRSAATRNASAASSMGNRCVISVRTMSGSSANMAAASSISRPPSWAQ